MFDIGFFELLLISVIALLVLGPERLPKAARTVGLTIGKIKRSFNNIQEELERQVRTEELKEKLKDPYATFMDDIEQEARISSPDSSDVTTEEALKQPNNTDNKDK